MTTLYLLALRLGMKTASYFSPVSMQLFAAWLALHTELCLQLKLLVCKIGCTFTLLHPATLTIGMVVAVKIHNLIIVSMKCYIYCVQVSTNSLTH